MSKEIWRPGNMLYPLPSVLVTVADDEGNDNVLTVAWTGTVCSDPGNGLRFSKTFKILTSYDKRNRGICNQSDNRRIGICHRLL